MLDYRLQTFLTLCETMHYTRAAERLCITQPAVTQHIHFLEQHYGCRLFVYQGKTLRLTEEGWAVYHYHHDLEKRAYGVLLKRMPDFTEEEFQSCLRVMEGIKRAASSRWNEKK